MITGGSEAGITPLGLAGFNASKALSANNENPEKASCPWDKKRDGFLLGGLRNISSGRIRFRQKQGS